VYKDLRRREPVKWERFLGEAKTTRLVLIGDANMAPSELMAASGSIDIHTSARKPGLEWLEELRTAYPVNVWLNPIRKDYWATCPTVRQIGKIFHMEDRPGRHQEGGRPPNLQGRPSTVFSGSLVNAFLGVGTPRAIILRGVSAPGLAP
jgi:hypothetical protein